MPSAREWRCIDADRADAERVHRAATWLRDDPARPGAAGLADPETAHPACRPLPGAVWWQAGVSARVILGKTMVNLAVRRTRRR